MDDLVSAIYALSNRTLFDYALVIVPIVLSGVAIWISISTARKQNKIALFDLRYKCITQIQAVLAYDTGIYNCEHVGITICLFDAYWNTDIAGKSHEEKIIKATGQLQIIHHDLLRSKLLFKHQCATDLADISGLLRTVVLNAVNGEHDLGGMEELHAKCEAFYATDFPILIKEAKIKNP